MKNKKIWLITGATIIVLILVAILGNRMGWLGGGYIRSYGYPDENNARYYHTSDSSNVGGSNIDGKGYTGSYTSAAQRFMDSILGLKRSGPIKNQRGC